MFSCSTFSCFDKRKTDNEKCGLSSPWSPLSGGLPLDRAAQNSGPQIDAAAAALYLLCKFSLLFRFISLFACSFSRSYNVHLFIFSFWKDFRSQWSATSGGMNNLSCSSRTKRKLIRRLWGYCWRRCASRSCMSAGAGCSQGHIISSLLLFLFSISFFLFKVT